MIYFSRQEGAIILIVKDSDNLGLDFKKLYLQQRIKQPAAVLFVDQACTYTTLLSCKINLTFV